MAEAQRVIITGATGLIGRAVSAELARGEHAGPEIVVFSRDAEAARRALPQAAEVVAWAPEETAETGAWAERVADAHAIIYLAGRSIYSFGHRESQSSVRAETAARIRGMRGLIAAMAALPAERRPRVFISASAVGAYGYVGFSDDEMTEASPYGADFWGGDCRAWEGAAQEAEALGARVVTLRTGYVLAGGAGTGLSGQAEQFRRGFGGPVAPGRQWSPWVHLSDVAGLVALALENDQARGPLNIVAPGIVRNREFAQALGAVVGRAGRFTTPGFGLRLALGVVADTIIHGRRVVPEKALALGYGFRFPQLTPALRDLLAPPAQATSGAAEAATEKGGAADV